MRSYFGRALGCLGLTLGLFLHASNAVAVSNTIVISEFRTRGPNGGNDEFIELFNVSDVSVNISGYRIMKSNGSGTVSEVVTIPNGIRVLPGRFYLIVNDGIQGYSGTVAGNLTYVGGIPDSGGLALFDSSNTLLDAVGTAAGSAYQEGLLLPPMSLNVNQSYERKNGGCSPGQDTDNNAVDFNVNGSTSNPQRSSTVCNPCRGVVCASPPNTECFAAAGSCVDGTCAYPQFDESTPCNDGDACTVGDACDVAGVCQAGTPNSCDTPPADFCSDPNTLVAYEATGTCDSNTGCSYASSSTSCQFGCDGILAQCSPNPCTGVSCVTPPNGCYDSAGTCAGGTCSYPFKADTTPCDDGNACTLSDACNGAGTCVPGTPVDVDDGNPCTIDSCDPATGNVTHQNVTNGVSCDDGNFCNGISVCQAGVCEAGEAVSCTNPPTDCYEDAGTCNPANGLCTYTPKNAATGCDDGDACTTNDQCDGSGTCDGATVECNPPAAECIDATTSRAYGGGTCDAADGSCSFTQTDTNCSAGCDDGTGLCNADPCAGVVCDSPPSQCHVATGTCAGGTCTYALKPQGAACDDGDTCTAADECGAAGVCAGSPLACNSPPPAECLDDATSRSYSASGTCSGGTCSYAESDVACDNGCNSDTGLCNGDPCTGVTCDEPPSVCHQDLGTCTGGTCSYALKPTGATCDDGDVCTEDDACNAAGECAGSTLECNSPPPSECASGTISKSFNAAGTCDDSSGECVYASTETECGSGCNTDTGLCAEDPCGEVVCNAPPGACYLDNGTCADGECTYEPRASGTPCDDDDPCTEDDACDGNGECSGSAGSGCGDAGTPPDAGSEEPDSAGPGESDAAVDAGSPPSGMDAGADAADAATAAPSSAGGGGCGCRTPRGASGAPSRGAWWLALGAWILLRRRRRC